MHHVLRLLLDVVGWLHLRQIQLGVVYRSALRWGYHLRLSSLLLLKILLNEELLLHCHLALLKPSYSIVNLPFRSPRHDQREED